MYGPVLDELVGGKGLVNKTKDTRHGRLVALNFFNGGDL